ncbi:MAG: TetR/AcrR family transcriptional regulator [Caulobacterales bacterium]
MRGVDSPADGEAPNPQPARDPAAARTTRRAPRRSALEARQEILDAAAYFLNRHRFRELTIPTLMGYTSVGRSAFYIHFKDIYGVVEALLARLRDQVLRYAEIWSAAEVSPAEGLKTFVSDIVNIWVVDGPMLSAMIDAAAEDSRLEQIAAEITGIYQRAVSEILAREHQAGRIDAMDFDEMAAALVLASQGYLKSRLGHPGRRDPLKVVETLQALWIRSIYGRAPS